MSERTLPPGAEFVKAVRAHAPEYGVEVDDETEARLRAYYDLLVAWNARLHLVAPCAPAEFATRHVLESLLALPHVADGARVADVGSGGGLPIIPLLAARPDLSTTLVEASPKKCAFLREAIHAVGAGARAEVVSARFEKIETPPVEYVSCRALERFAEMLSPLLAWTPPASTLLLFGGDALGEKLARAGREFATVRAPRSEMRYLFVIEPHHHSSS